MALGTPLLRGDSVVEFVSREKLKDHIGVERPPSDWVLIDQDRINKFADATIDHQFIHIDQERAAAGPFGATIAHGFLTLSLVSHLAGESGIAPEGVAMTINYGSDKVRFLSPVKCGSRVRSHSVLLEVTEKNPGQLLTKSRVTIEIENENKPALVAEILSLFILADS